MQIEITPYYSKADSPSNPFWYKSEIDGRIVCSCGTSWDEAKARHVQKVSDMLSAPEPPLPEMIEV